MKKKIICFATVMVLLFTICGCTSGTDSSTADGKKTGNVETVDDIDFGGQTFTKTIIGAVSKSLMRRKDAFEKKHNCKIELVSLQWEQYNSQVATRMASGNPYDICGLQTFFFPEAVVQGLYEPLEDYIYEADKYNPETGVGIDLNVGSVFDMNGHIYGVSNHSGSYASMITVLYYNKVMFEAAGLEDPLELYKSGQWTWDKLMEIGAKVTNPSKGKYLLGNDFGSFAFLSSNGYHPTTKDADGKVLTNLSDSKLVNALAKLKEFYAKYVGPKGFSDDPTEFYNGNYYMFQQGAHYGKLYMMPTIENSAAFDNDIANLGVVPYPYGPDNTEKANPGGGAASKAAGKGSKDPRIVIAWTKFEQQFEDPMADEDPYLYSEDTQKVIDKLFDNVLDSIPNYKTSSNSVGNGYSEMIDAAKNNGDYVKVINDYSSIMQSIINESLKQ